MKHLLSFINIYVRLILGNNWLDKFNVTAMKSIPSICRAINILNGKKMIWTWFIIMFPNK